MPCANGRVRLRDDEDRRLFAASAGTCLLCNQPLFRDQNDTGRSVPIAERAHIIAHSSEGPRADPAATATFRESTANIILLCPSCHTEVDKAPESYPATELLARKNRRKEAVALVGGSPTFTDRTEAHGAVRRLLETSRSLFERYGPDGETGVLPTREAAERWSEKVIQNIIPNHRLVAAIVAVNSELATHADRRAAALLEAHADDLEGKHTTTGPITGAGARFPKAADSIFADE